MQSVRSSMANLMPSNHNQGRASNPYKAKEPDSHVKPSRSSNGSRPGEEQIWPQSFVDRSMAETKNARQSPSVGPFPARQVQGIARVPPAPPRMRRTTSGESYPAHHTSSRRYEEDHDRTTAFVAGMVTANIMADDTPRVHETPCRAETSYQAPDHSYYSCGSGGGDSGGDSGGGGGGD